MIRFEHVTVREQHHEILRDISFEIAAREKAVFYGTSGSGKTTVLNTLIGAHVPAGGMVVFNGRQVTPATISSIRQSVAYIPQDPVTGADTVREALLLPFTYKANCRNAPSQQDISRTLERLHLDPVLLPRECSVLSGGEKQRIVIARALLLRKTVFVLDEFTSALDRESKKAVFGLFGDSTYTIISVSHDPAWMGFCSRFFRVAGGTVTEAPPPPDGGERG